MKNPTTYQEEKEIHKKTAILIFVSGYTRKIKNNSSSANTCLAYIG